MVQGFGFYGTLNPNPKPYPKPQTLNQYKLLGLGLMSSSFAFSSDSCGGCPELGVPFWRSLQ